MYDFFVKLMTDHIIISNRQCYMVVELLQNVAGLKSRYLGESGTKIFGGFSLVIVVFI